MTEMIWIRPKQFGPDQNNLDSPMSKIILDLYVEGQGISN